MRAQQISFALASRVLLLLVLASATQSILALPAIQDPLEGNVELPPTANIDDLPDEALEHLVRHVSGPSAQAQANTLHAFAAVSPTLRATTQRLLKLVQLDRTALYPVQENAWYKAAVVVITPRKQEDRIVVKLGQIPNDKQTHNQLDTESLVSGLNNLNLNQHKSLEQLQFIVQQGLENRQLTEIQLQRLLVHACLYQWKDAQTFLEETLHENGWKKGKAADMCTLNHEQNLIAYKECGLDALKFIKTAPENDETMERLQPWPQTLLCLDFAVSGPQLEITTLLQRALDQKKHRFAELLLQEGADLRVKVGNPPWTMLHTAVFNLDARAVQLLLRYGADPNAVGFNGKTPLHCASGPTAVRLLLQYGARVDARDHEGEQPIHKIRNAEVIRRLAKAGSDPRAKDGYGRTTLEKIAVSGPVDVLEMMLQDPRSAEVLQGRLKHGGTLLHVAASAGNTDTVQFLIPRTPDLNARNDDGQTAFEIVSESRRYHVPLHPQVQRLADMTSQVNAPAYAAIRQMLREAGANVPESY